MILIRRGTCSEKKFNSHYTNSIVSISFPTQVNKKKFGIARQPYIDCKYSLFSIFHRKKLLHFKKYI